MGGWLEGREGGESLKQKKGGILMSDDDDKRQTEGEKAVFKGGKKGDW